MVKLKFDSAFVDSIVHGDKRATIRLDLGEEGFQRGDDVECCTPDGEVFAEARIVNREVLSPAHIITFGVSGHEAYESLDDFYKAMERYYPSPWVRGTDEFDVLWFRVKPSSP